MQRLKIKSRLTRAALLLVMLLTTAQTAWAFYITTYTATKLNVDVEYNGLTMNDATVQVSSKTQGGHNIAHTVRDGVGQINLFGDKDVSVVVTPKNGKTIVTTFSTQSSVKITKTGDNSCSFTAPETKNMALKVTVKCTSSYTVDYEKNANDVTGTMAQQIFDKDVAQNLTANSFTRPGYYFTGWNTEADGSGTNYTDGQNVTNLTSPGNIVALFAQWTLCTDYTVHFDANGGSGTMPTNQLNSTWHRTSPPMSSPAPATTSQDGTPRQMVVALLSETHKM